MSGINFRATSNYVTDGDGETYSIGDAYPQTRGGITFGWTVTDGTFSTRDRNASNDRRLAGMNFQTNNGTQAVFRIDLPAAGTYDIRIALGDAAYAQGYHYLQVRDGSTPLLTITDADGTAANHFDDAAGTDFTNVTWPAGNVAARMTFTGTICNVVIGSSAAQVNSTCLAHFSFALVPIRRRLLIAGACR